MPSTPHILILGPVPPPYGGVSVHVQRLHGLLAKHGRQSLVLAKDAPPTEDPGIVRIQGRWGFFAGLLRHGRNASLIHDHTQHYQMLSPLLVLLSSIAYRLLRCPKILTVHDGTFTPRVQSAGSLVRMMMRWYLRFYREVLVISEELFATVESLGVPKSRIHLVRTFLVERQMESDLPVKVKDFIREHSPVWLVAGAYHETYHFDVVARAFALYESLHPGAGLILVSGGFTNDPHMRARVQHASESHASHLLDLQDVGPGVLRELYDQADIFIRSAYPDGDGVSLREAIMGRCAVVAAENGGRPEGVPCYNPEDAADLMHVVEEALAQKDEERRSDMREYTRRMAEDNFYRIVAVYDSLLAAPSN